MTDPATDPRPARAPERSHDEARTALLDAARAVLANDGPAALTVRRIAADAGMSTMNVYSRFGGKDGVVEELFVEGFLRLRAAMEGVGHSDDTIADLRAAGIAYRRFALDNPTSYSIMFQRPIVDFAPSPHAMEVASGTLRVLADLIERAMDAGGLRPAEPLATAAAMWASCHGVVSLELSGTSPDGVSWPAVYDHMQRTVLRGLGATLPDTG